MDDWLYWAVDALASEYGWTLDYIFNSLYLEEVLMLLAKIKPRKNAEYRIWAAIIQSPHSKEPGKIFSILEENDREGTEVSAGTGVELLKLALSKNPRFVVK